MAGRRCACGDPVKPSSVDSGPRRTCGKAKCLFAARRKKAADASGWPEVTGEDVFDFSPYEIEPRDGGVRRMSGQPIRHSWGVAQYGTDR